MAVTRISAKQVLPDGLTREDMNIDLPGQAVITKVITGDGIKMSNTGCDDGTGDVTIYVPNYYFIQDAPASVWDIEHNLGKLMPMVTVCDKDGNEVVGDIRFLSPNRCILTFNPETSGQAFLS